MVDEALKQRGARIREGRIALGLSQVSLGEKVGVRQAAVTKWETGASEPPLATRLALAAVLGFDPYAIEAPSSTTPDLQPMAAAESASSTEAPVEAKAS